jgi:hypothetical protein
MPVIVDAGDLGQWLDPTEKPDSCLTLRARGIFRARILFFLFGSFRNPD